MFNVGQTRVRIGEAKYFKELPWDDGMERLNFHERDDHPAYKAYLVIEFDAKTGYWTMDIEKRLRPEYGGEVYQEQTLEQLALVHQASKEHSARPDSSM